MEYFQRCPTSALILKLPCGNDYLNSINHNTFLYYFTLNAKYDARVGRFFPSLKDIFKAILKIS